MWIVQCWVWVWAFLKNSIVSVSKSFCLLDSGNLCELGLQYPLPLGLSHLLQHLPFPHPKLGKIWDQSITYVCLLYFYYAAISSRHLYVKPFLFYLGALSASCFNQVSDKELCLGNSLFSLIKVILFYHSRLSNYVIIDVLSKIMPIHIGFLIMDVITTNKGIETMFWDWFALKFLMII